MELTGWSQGGRVGPRVGPVSDQCVTNKTISHLPVTQHSGVNFRFHPSFLFYTILMFSVTAITMHKLQHKQLIQTHI